MKLCLPPLILLLVKCLGTAFAAPLGTVGGVGTRYPFLGKLIMQSNDSQRCKEGDAMREVKEKKLRTAFGQFVVEFKSIFTTAEWNVGHPEDDSRWSFIVAKAARRAADRYYSTYTHEYFKSEADNDLANRIFFEEVENLTVFVIDQTAQLLSKETSDEKACKEKAEQQDELVVKIKELFFPKYIDLVKKEITDHGPFRPCHRDDYGQTIEPYCRDDVMLRVNLWFWCTYPFVARLLRCVSPSVITGVLQPPAKEAQAAVLKRIVLEQPSIMEGGVDCAQIPRKWFLAWESYLNLKSRQQQLSPPSANDATIVPREQRESSSMDQSQRTSCTQPDISSDGNERSFDSKIDVKGTLVGAAAMAPSLFTMFFCYETNTINDTEGLQVKDGNNITYVSPAMFDTLWLWFGGGPMLASKVDPAEKLPVFRKSVKVAFGDTQTSPRITLFIWPTMTAKSVLDLAFSMAPPEAIGLWRGVGRLTLVKKATYQHNVDDFLHSSSSVEPFIEQYNETRFVVTEDANAPAQGSPQTNGPITAACMKHEEPPVKSSGATKSVIAGPKADDAEIRLQAAFLDGNECEAAKREIFEELTNQNEALREELAACQHREESQKEKNAELQRKNDALMEENVRLKQHLRQEASPGSFGSSKPGDAPKDSPFKSGTALQAALLGKGIECDADGKYTLVEKALDDDAPVAVVQKPTGEKVISRPSRLHPRLQDVLKVIFDKDMFKSQMSQMKLDASKMPLGKLTKAQIEKGYHALEDLEHAITEKKARTVLEELTSKFYTIIPHDFGRMRPPVISLPEEVKQKYDLLNVLNDIQIAVAMDANASVTETEEHPLDKQFKELGCGLEYVDPASEEFAIIQRHTQVTQGYRKCRICHAFRVDRPQDKQRMNEFKQLGNRRLLWHGTNIAVVAAILKTGLRIMPHAGGRVGRGLYFASENGKSAGYVQCDGKTGFMFLVEAAMGNYKEINQDDSSLCRENVHADSILARGRQEPDASKDIQIDGEWGKITVPQGPPIPQPQWHNSTFSQSEYLIYNEGQARIKYVLMMEFP